MRNRFILALDQGTTGSRAFLFNHKGDIVATDYQEFTQYFPKPGWVEHDADEIWHSIEDVIRGALRKAKINPKQIAAVGITNQRETTVLWDRKTSKPKARAIVWQCRRTTDICQSLKKYKNIFQKKTGLVLDPYFSGTKIKWLLDNVKGLRREAQKGRVCFGTVDSWLIWKLTGGASHATDMTNASRTLIFNIRVKTWDKALLKILNIPHNILPQVNNSGSIFGYTASGVAGLPEGIPIASNLGDQQAALYGQSCYAPGTVKNTYGTGCFIMCNTGNKLIYSKKGLLTTLASNDQGQPVYALEGAVFIAGAVVQWLRDQLQIIRNSRDSEKLIRGLKNANGVYFVPAFVGLGAPYWDANARGIITGLTRGANKAHIARAALESIAYQTKDVFDIIEQEAEKKIAELKVDGGAVANDFLMQFQADILGCRIIKPRVIESTARGAAYLAGVTVGLWKGKGDLVKLNTVDKIFSPRMPAQAAQKLYAGWQEAVTRARSQ